MPLPNRPRRAAPFLIVEVAALAVVEFGNLFSLASIPVSHRVVIAAIAVVFFALGFVRTRTPSSAWIMLTLDALVLAGFVVFSGIGGLMTGLLAIRALERRPSDRRAFVVCVAVGVCLFAVSYITGERIEHRPAQALAPIFVIPFYAVALSLSALLDDLIVSRAALDAARTEAALRGPRWETLTASTERHRMARRLQTELGGGLRALGRQLEEALRLRPSNPEVADLMTFRAQRTAMLTAAALGRIAEESSASCIGLKSALFDLCEAFAASSGLRIDPAIDDDSIDDPVAVANLTRIVREALINVARHSGATCVQLSLTRTDDRRLRLQLSDDGDGFEVCLARPGKGLAIMQDCARLLGGTCRIESARSRGTVIRVEIPSPGIPSEPGSNRPDAA